MAKTLNITDKLSFDTKHILQIKDVEIVVNADAATMLELMDASESMDTNSAPFIKKSMKLLFSDEGTKKLQELNLSLADLAIVIKAASDLAVANENEDDEGNVPLPTTTSEETLG